MPDVHLKLEAFKSAVLTKITNQLASCVEDVKTTLSGITGSLIDIGPIVKDLDQRMHELLVDWPHKAEVMCCNSFPLLEIIGSSVGHRGDGGRHRVHFGIIQAASIAVEIM